MVSIDKTVQNYERLVMGLGEEEDYLQDESLLALIARDAIQDHWDELTGEQRSRVQTVDAVLADKAALVASTLPNPNFEDRSRWWWFLHEGPQVREEATEAA